MGPADIVRDGSELLVESTGCSKWCSVLMWQASVRAESSFAIVRCKDTGQVFAAKRRLGAWIELSWADIMAALSRDERAHDVMIKELALAAVGE